MNHQKFREMIERKGEQQLIAILENARKQKAVDYENLVLDKLNSTFPTWDKAKSGGRTPNRAIFKGGEQSFNSAKDGFIWLVKQMASYNPRPFVTHSPELVKISKSRQRNYLALSPQLLFIKSPHLAEDETRYEPLPHDWFLNVNLNNKSKFEVLAKLSWVLDYEFSVDWDWIVNANTTDFYERRDLQSVIEKIQDILRYE